MIDSNRGRTGSHAVGICAAWIALALTLLDAHGQAQTPSVPTITSEGEAYVSVAPTRADFWLTARRLGATTREAADAAVAFTGQVEAAVEERGLKPLTIEPSGVRIPSIENNEAIASVRVRFPVIRFANDDDKAESFASLCDDVAALASALNCTVDGPKLIVDDADDPEQQAVSQATENALYKADAIARLLQSQIYAVESVEILGVDWLLESSTDKAYAPSVGQVTCRGRVRVVYLISAVE